MTSTRGKNQGFFWTHRLTAICFVSLFIGNVRSFSQPQSDGAFSREVLSHDPNTRGKCLSLHLMEARTLNTVRQPHYGRMTEGASQGVSKTLILSESLALPFAHIMERWARPLARAGVDIFCDVVVSMDGTPPLQENPTKISLKNPVRPWKGIDQLLPYFWYGLTLKDEGLAAALNSQQKVLAADPHSNCMQRHLLESISRAVSFAPRHRQASAEVGYGLRGAFLVQFNILTQIGLLPLGFWLDHQAAPVHKLGIPIICGDVPPVPIMGHGTDGSISH